MKFTKSFKHSVGNLVCHGHHCSHIEWYVLLRVRSSVTDNNGFWIGYIGTYITITTNYNSSQSLTVWDSLPSLLDCECLLFHCDWLGRIGTSSASVCPLVNTPQLNTELSYDWITELCFITRGEPREITTSNSSCILCLSVATKRA
jgi:hypothetical protein